jgi:ATP synthase protein I
MSDGDARESLRELGRRIDAAQDARGSAAPSGDAAANAQASGSALAMAWRVGIELMVAILVATGLGWAFDHWLGTRPWGMIVMFFLGVAAGMVSVWRAVAGMGGAVGFRQPGAAAAKELGKDED